MLTAWSNCSCNSFSLGFFCYNLLPDGFDFGFTCPFVILFFLIHTIIWSTADLYIALKRMNKTRMWKQTCNQAFLILITIKIPKVFLESWMKTQYKNIGHAPCRICFTAPNQLWAGCIMGKSDAAKKQYCQHQPWVPEILKHWDSPAYNMRPSHHTGEMWERWKGQETEWNYTWGDMKNILHNNVQDLTKKKCKLYTMQLKQI